MTVPTRSRRITNVRSTAVLFGPVVSVIGGGVGTIVVVIATALLWPQIRRIGHLHQTADLEEPIAP